MLLRDLMKSVRIGDDEHWRTERPSVQVKIRAKLWIVRRHRLRKMSDCICLVAKAAVVGASNLPNRASSIVEIPSF